MSQSEKAGYFRALKAAGVDFEKHYREYTTEELKKNYDALVDRGVITPAAEPAPSEHPQNPDLDLPDSSFFGVPPIDAGESDVMPTHAPLPGVAVEQHAPLPQPPSRPVPLAERDPREMAGQRQNSQPEDEPIRVDEFGRLWYQEEIKKPAMPKPRGRRVLQYMDTGTKTQTFKSGDYTESFEVAGDETPRVSEVKITLPSYQVGIYKDPRFPFKVHTYNGIEGFDLFNVQEYYGGAELVPAGIKRMYVENVLCYDIRTTVRAIQDEYRALQLAGKVD